MRADVRMLGDAAAVAVAGAAFVAERLGDACAARGRATLVVAGDAAARAVCAQRAARDDVPWADVTVLFSDERCGDDRHSNARMLEETLLRRQGDVRVVRVDSRLPAAGAAARYEQELRAATGIDAPDVPVFDVVLLGLGADGDTASLYPGTPFDRLAGLAAATRSPRPPHDRVTLTLAALNAARDVLFCVTGADRAAVFARALAGDASIPAAHVRPEKEPVWLVDDEAMGGPGD